MSKRSTATRTFVAVSVAITEIPWEKGRPASRPAAMGLAS
jgi:hypothetical protein